MQCAVRSTANRGTEMWCRSHLVRLDFGVSATELLSLIEYLFDCVPASCVRLCGRVRKFDRSRTLCARAPPSTTATERCTGPGAVSMTPWPSAPGRPPDHGALRSVARPTAGPRLRGPVPRGGAGAEPSVGDAVADPARDPGGPGGGRPPARRGRLTAGLGRGQRHEAGRRPAP